MQSPLCVNHQLPQCRSLIPPRINRSNCLSVSIASALIIDHLCVDRRLPPYRFSTFLSLIYGCLISFFKFSQIEPKRNTSKLNCDCSILGCHCLANNNTTGITWNLNNPQVPLLTFQSSSTPMPLVPIKSLISVRFFQCRYSTHIPQLNRPHGISLIWLWTVRLTLTK